MNSLKIISLLFSIIITTNINLLCKYNWEEILPQDNQNDRFSHFKIGENKIYILNDAGKYRIYDLIAKKITKEGSFSDYYGSLRLTGAFVKKDSIYYLTTISQDYDNSLITVLDDDFEVINEIPSFYDNMIINNIIFNENDIFYTLIDLPLPDAYIVKTNSSNKIISEGKINTNGTNEQFINRFGVNENNIYLLNQTGKLFYSDLNEYNIQKINLDEFGLQSTRDLLVKDNYIYIFHDNGRVIMSSNSGTSFQELSYVGASFRTYCSLKENNYILIGGTDQSTGIGKVFVSFDNGDNWELIFENSGSVRNLVNYKNNIYCQLNNGSVYSIDEISISSVETTNTICQKTQELDCYDLLGNKLEENNIYNKQIIVRYKCIETGEITHKLEIRER